MLESKFTNCENCGDIADLLKRIDCKLAELSYNMYNNVVFMLNACVPSYELTQLLAYRDILINKQNNPDYAEHFSVEDIAGKVIRLTAGCKLRCPKVNQVCIPTTTSTTTISCAITSGEITCVIPT